MPVNALYISKLQSGVIVVGERSWERNTRLMTTPPSLKGFEVRNLSLWATKPSQVLKFRWFPTKGTSNL